MISPEEIRARALKFWNSQKIQRAHLEGISLFPWEIPVPRTPARGLVGDFQRIRDGIRVLGQGAKESAGEGYTVRYQRVNHRQLGDQAIPDRIVFETLEDFLRFTGMQTEFWRFLDTTAMLLASRPGLLPFLIRRPGTALVSQEDWTRLLSVCRYFEEHPKPGVYLRQLEIPGVHTKFIETRKALLAELLEFLLPDDAKGPCDAGDRAFERRFGLRVESPTVRFRLLGDRSSLGGLSDVSATLPEFARLTLPIRTVFIVENKMNGLCFPDCPNAIVVFGLGYAARSLAEVPWMGGAEIRYWGDIDTHGFAILNQVREVLPHVQSFLMDAKTLMQFKELWVQEEAGQRFMKDLPHLLPAERELFESLRDNRWGDSVRLEQERIAFARVRAAVTEASAST